MNPLHALEMARAALKEGQTAYRALRRASKARPHEQDRHLGGEAEARLAQNRQRMREPGRMGLAAKVAPYLTPEQKRKLYPWTKVGGLDVPLEYLIP